MLIKPKCRLCNQIYLGGADGCCHACLSGNAPPRKPKRLRCMCGRKAVLVMLAEVVNADGETLTVEIPLCAACKKQELLLEKPQADPPPAAANPLQVIVVKSLPRAHAPLRGSKIG
ncbi:MAG: hypothetical protein IT297_02775 [Anaerolineae bacterium]|jgi:hypothetical protein|nr:hypothetical protein [Anaerolineae bacterium]MCZ7553188.1 hypothetical protein [Anaerolineales bacterium]